MKSLKNLEKYLNKNNPFVDDGSFNGEHNDNQKIRQAAMRKLCLDISNHCRVEICCHGTDNLTDAWVRIDEMHDLFTDYLKLTFFNCLQVAVWS